MKKEHNKKTSKPEKDIKDLEEEIVVEQESEIAMLERKLKEHLDGWQRSQAEFENYKKRTAEANKDMIKYASQNVILQILPVIDNFHSSTSHIPEDQKENPWVTGIMYIQKQLENVLADNGIEEITINVGDNFDPVYHEAIEDKDCGDCEVEHKFKNKIKQILTKGYKIGDKVIRPARVVVE